MNCNSDPECPKRVAPKLPCFAAGTLVHTKDGLKSIEQIQVGNWVLSKHESGEGERAYKRVTQTFVHEHQLVKFFSVGGLNSDGEDRYQDLLVTPEHPIWMKGKGWKSVQQLKAGLFVEMLSEDNARISLNVDLFLTDQPGTVWLPGSGLRCALESFGSHVDVSTFAFAPEAKVPPFKSARSIRPEHRYYTTVYNFEVEDFHTYYVGEKGIWVHNKNITAGNVPISNLDHVSKT